MKKSNAWKDVHDKLIMWSMTTFQALDLNKSKAWKDVHDNVEHDHLPDIRFEEI